jgi:hypothetical protein
MGQDVNTHAELTLTASSAAASVRDSTALGSAGREWGRVPDRRSHRETPEEWKLWPMPHRGCTLPAENANPWPSRSGLGPGTGRSRTPCPYDAYSWETPARAEPNAHCKL